MDSSRGKTTIQVAVETVQKLKKVKKEKNFASMDEVLRWYTGDSPEGELRVGPQAPEEEQHPGDKKKRKVNVREPLYSLEILAEREGMLYYLTGFERSEVDLLVKRFAEVRKLSCFLSIGIACPCCTLVFVF
jgi:hypothetical protein